ncbi:hypothetical protein J3459_012513 [Metarhizium acridum]|uniref:uncharacterized protein n=1 Tax=Metarhizium acridum TaxID=92637 RepID=UPI001C6BE5D3|nr:hypothetical protein J3459_012513 [Metarhizium acridum]KAG8419624.1 hypothetical protein J3458_004480 [Metarhizium acridum]
MKYSVLSLAALLTASSLAFPGYYWGWRQGEAGDAIVMNHMNIAVDVDKVTPSQLFRQVKATGEQVYYIEAGGAARIPGGPVADLKINRQVEVSYVGGDGGTFNYAIKPLDHFPGVVEVTPDGCEPLVWHPGDPETRQVTCPEGTELPIRLYGPFQAGWY